MEAFAEGKGEDHEKNSFEEPRHGNHHDTQVLVFLQVYVQTLVDGLFGSSRCLCLMHMSTQSASCPGSPTANIDFGPVGLESQLQP